MTLFWSALCYLAIPFNHFQLLEVWCLSTDMYIKNRPGSDGHGHDHHNRDDSAAPHAGLQHLVLIADGLSWQWIHVTNDMPSEISLPLGDLSHCACLMLP